MKVSEEIKKTQAEMLKLKPRAKRRTILETRLRDLRLKQLRSEIRINRQRAA